MKNKTSHRKNNHPNAAGRLLGRMIARSGRLIPCAAIGLSACLLVPLARADNLATLRPERTTGLSNGGWNNDRYTDMEPLHAGQEIVVADLEGPGIITHIHTTRHRPKELFARGIVLEIWFDDAEQPAVMAPLADFFGDGGGGDAIYFSTPLIESAPWSYNCYFPMPFKERARVILRNDTDRNANNYSYVEWESLPEWDPSMGYFHATYRRDVFQLTPETDHSLFEVEGSGHLVGRQYSITHNDPFFTPFSYIMEGNNEIDVDGRERWFDYLGTEDSFTFSWGFQNRFAGLRAGMPLIEKGKNKPMQRLSIYRFHDHMPIRFDESLTWNINWSEEGHARKPHLVDPWREAVEGNGCWIDLAHVYYWYEDRPGGFEHAPLRPVAERQRKLLKSSVPADPGAK